MVLAVVLEVALLLGFGYLIFRRKRAYLEKKKYAKRHSVTVDRKIRAPFAGSIFASEGLSTMTDMVEINPTCSWQQIELVLPVEGGVKKGIDSLLFAGSDFFFYKLLCPDIVTFLDQKQYGFQPAIPENIADFLDKYNCSIDSGGWGLLLLKNDGYFSAAEVEEIVLAVGDVKYLRRKCSESQPVITQL